MADLQTLISSALGKKKRLPPAVLPQNPDAGFTPSPSQNITPQNADAGFIPRTDEFPTPLTPPTPPTPNPFSTVEVSQAEPRPIDALAVEPRFGSVMPPVEQPQAPEDFNWKDFVRSNGGLMKFTTAANSPAVTQAMQTEAQPETPPAAMQPTMPRPTTPPYNPDASSPLTVMPRTQAAQAKIDAIKNKEYGFRKYRDGDTLEEGQTVDEKGYILDASGKKIPGKDRDSDHNWWDSLKSAGIGALFGFLNGGLGGAAGGAIAGAIGGAASRDFDERMWDNYVRLPKAEQERVQAMALDEFESKLQTAAVGRENVREDNRRNAEQFGIREQNRFLRDRERYRQREEQEKRQAEREGNRWKPYTDEQGKRWRMYNDGRQEAIPDPDDPSGKTQDVDPNFKTYSVYSPVSNTMVSIRGRDLYSAETQTERTNVQIANQEQDDDAEYKNKLGEWQSKQADFDAKMSSNQLRIEWLGDQITNDQNELNAIPEKVRTQEQLSRKQKLQAQIAANDREMKNLIAENKRIRGEKDANEKAKPAKPQPRQRVTSPQAPGKYSGQTFESPASLRAYFPRKTDDQIREIVTKNGGTFQQ